MFITVGIDLYADLRAVLPGISVADDDLHARLDTDTSAVCQLEAFYVLGDVAQVAPEAFASSGCVRVAIETDDAASLVISVALNRLTAADTYEPVVSLERSPASGPLVCELLARRHAQPARRTHGNCLCWL